MKRHRFDVPVRVNPWGIGRQPRRWYRWLPRIAGAVLATIAAVAVIVLAVGIFVVPRVMGGTSLTVLTGSMAPTLRPGDVVAVRGVAQAEVCRDVQIGQIISYLPKPQDPTLITHRVVGKTIGNFSDATSCRLITQGDANSTVDEPVSPVQVRGVFLYGLPKLGWARQWVVTHRQGLAILTGLAFIASLIWAGVRPPKTRVIAYHQPADAAEPALADPSGSRHQLRP